MPEHDLGALIDMEIRQTGPMTIAGYMTRALNHGRLGYYAAGGRVGLTGDFITAPEISQMFGELIGFWCVNLWQEMKEPKSFTLLELGPGRGTLMADLLRAATKAPGFRDALHLQLFDSNRDLRGLQQERLREYDPYWADEIDAVGDDPLIVIANEFFDALPIRQFVRAERGWHERQVGLREGKRTFGLSPALIENEAMPAAARTAAAGEVYEYGVFAEAAIKDLAEVVARQGGAILAIDYGYAKTQTGETLQAIRNHAFADPLDAPGETDISAHVNFEALAQAAVPLETKLTTQRDFLTRLGIAERAAALVRANPAELDSIEAALKRLIAPDQMGELFKVFCAHSPGLESAGFA